MAHAQTLSTSGFGRGSGTGLALALAALWILVSGALGTIGLYEVPLGRHPEILITAILMPTLAFGFAYTLFSGVREWARSLDLALLTLPHSWRTIGFSFLALWYFGILPAEFAAPAGFGDIAIALAAPVVAAALWREWRGARQSALWLHILGIVDFLFAVSIGAGIGTYGSGVDRLVALNPMSAFPMVLVPAIGVPLLLVGHVIALTHIVATRSRSNQT